VAKSDLAELQYDFSNLTKDALARRAGFHCSYWMAGEGISTMRITIVSAIVPTGSGLTT